MGEQQRREQRMADECFELGRQFERAEWEKCKVKNSFINIDDSPPGTWEIYLKRKEEEEKDE